MTELDALKYLKSVLVYREGKVYFHSGKEAGYSSQGYWRLSASCNSGRKRIKMQRIVSADWLQPGEVIFHEPRGHYYELLHRTLIKSDVKGGSWSKGWCYQEVKSVEVLKNCIRHEPPAGEVYSRPNELFDEDWRLVTPV